MPAWDDPAVKWDDPAVGWAGGAVSTAQPVQWDDAVGTWSDGGQGWSGERTDLAYAAKPGLYVKNPTHAMSHLTGAIVTQGIPGQPAGAAGITAMKIVVPPGQEAAHIEYDLYPWFPTGWGVRWNRGWVSVSDGDDGATWTGPSWWTGSVYQRFGNTIWRALWSADMPYSARARLPDGDWCEMNRPLGVVPAPGPTLPTDGFLIRPTLFTGHGPRGKDPGSSAARDAGSMFWRERTMGGNAVTIYRRATYPTISINLNGPTQATSFSVNTAPSTGGKVYGRIHWRQGNNFLISQFMVDAGNPNPFATPANNTVIVNADTLWHGYTVSQVWGTNYWILSPGIVLTCEAYSLMGRGSPSDPYYWSAQGYFAYNA